MQIDWDKQKELDKQYYMGYSDFGDGRRLYGCRMDSSSGSTMVFRGKFIGEFTAEDIIKHFGDGSFGHRGPVFERKPIVPGQQPEGGFTYTKITD